MEKLGVILEQPKIVGDNKNAKIVLVLYAVNAVTYRLNKINPYAGQAIGPVVSISANTLLLYTEQQKLEYYRSLKKRLSMR
jgi:hypothetical protein